MYRFCSRSHHARSDDPVNGNHQRMKQVSCHAYWRAKSPETETCADEAV